MPTGSKSKRLPRRKLLYFEEDTILRQWEPFCRRAAGWIMQYHQAARFVGFDDALQEARLIALDAYSLYDQDRGVKFSTYLTHIMRGKLRSWVRVQGLIRVPSYVQDNRQGREKPGAIKYARFARAAAMVQQPPLDRLQLEDRDDDAWAGSVEDELPDEQMPVIAAAIASLDRRHRVVIEMQFGFGRWQWATVPTNSRYRSTLEEVGRELGGITKERVRQLQAEALEILREKLDGVAT